MKGKIYYSKKLGLYARVKGSLSLLTKDQCRKGSSVLNLSLSTRSHKCVSFLQQSRHTILSLYF